MRNPIGESNYITRKACWGEAAVKAYPAGDPDDLETTILDMIGDVLHYAEAQGIENPETLLDSGLNHYHCEGGNGHEPDDIASAEVDYHERNPV